MTLGSPLPILAQGGVFGVPAIGSPFQPVFSLHSNEFTDLLQSGSTCVLAKVEKTHRIQVTPDKRHAYYQMNLAVCRTLIGDSLSEDSLNLDSVKQPSYGFRIGDQLRPLAAGDFVFVLVRPGQEKSAREFQVYFAHSKEIERVGRVQQLLTLEDSQQAATRAISGCSDSDPYFAMWCLRLIRPATGFQADFPLNSYEVIRRHVSREARDEAVWKVLQNAGTHPLTYAYADAQIQNDTIASDKQFLRHQCHCRRLKSFAKQQLDVGNFDYFDGEVGHILGTSYPAMPAEMRIEVIGLLLELINASDDLHNAIFLTWAFGLYSKDAKVSDKLFQLYRENIPLNSSNNRLRSRGIDGLIALMCEQSKDIGQLSETGLVLIENSFSTANGIDAASLTEGLERYAVFCRDHKIAWDSLENRLRKMNAIAITDEQHQAIRQLLKRLNVKLTTTNGT